MTTTNIKSASINTRFVRNRVLTSLFAGTLLLATVTPLQAQEVQYATPSWWVGVAAGANFNFYRGSTQKLNESLTAPVAFHNGNGVGVFVAPLVEYHRPGSRWGGMFQVGYDGRSSSFKQVLTPCNCPADLSTKLSYITVEPNLRFAPFKSNFYLFAGPRIAFNVNKSFTYIQHPNPNYPEQVPSAEVKGDLSDVRKTLVSAQIGAGYDIALSTKGKRSQFVLSPFVSFQPYFGQEPRTIETWNVTTLRAGAALKFGRGKKMTTGSSAAVPVEKLVSEPSFTVYAPKNIPAERSVKETFPLRNYVFFDLGSTEIPNRYVKLEKAQVKDFKEDQLQEFAPKKLSGRSKRQMIVYYNVLNIVGDRMSKNPATSIKLVGSSEKGPGDAKVMAESIKFYLTSVFAIDGSRIVTEGRDKPKIPSEQPGGTKELKLLRECDRRVSIESSSPVLLMEFVSGSGTPLKPVEIVALQEAPLDSYVTFNNAGGKDAFTSWSLEIADEKGKVQYFGPYTQDNVSIPGKTILGARPEGDYTVTMIGKTKNGQLVKSQTKAHMVLWTPAKDEQGMRYSIIFEINVSDATSAYEKYLAEVVTPKIPAGGTVIIHGHTDIVGDEMKNLELSKARATEVKGIIEKSLETAGRKDVKFEVFGFGEDTSISPFENRFPEERFYNRTVVIDIIPTK